MLSLRVKPLKCRDSEVKRHEMRPRNEEIMATKKWKLSLKVSPPTDRDIYYLFCKIKRFQSDN